MNRNTYLYICRRIYNTHIGVLEAGARVIVPLRGEPGKSGSVCQPRVIPSIEKQKCYLIR